MAGADLSFHAWRALDQYREQLAAEQRPIPVGMEDLIDHFRKGASGVRQEPTILQRGAQRAHDGPMPTWSTLDEVASEFGLSRRAIERLIAAGTLPSTKIGAARRVHRDHIAEFAAGRT